MSCATSGPTVNVEMHINDLADFVFKRNIHNSEIYLQLFEVENIQDLFFFCLDLFCKGLVMLYGSENRVCLEDLTMEQFVEVRKKMLLAGIEVTLNVEPIDLDGEEPSDATNQPVTMIRVIESTLNVSLSDYKFHVRTQKMMYTIHFDLVLDRHKAHKTTADE